MTGGTLRVWKYDAKYIWYRIIVYIVTYLVSFRPLPLPLTPPTCLLLASLLILRSLLRRRCVWWETGRILDSHAGPWLIIQQGRDRDHWQLVPDDAPEHSHHVVTILLHSLATSPRRFVLVLYTHTLYIFFVLSLSLTLLRVFGSSRPIRCTLLYTL